MMIEHVKLGEDGRIVIPANSRRELGLQPGQILVIESDGDSLLVRSAENALRESQNYFQQFITPGVDPVDELIAERRAEAEAEGERSRG
jgi:AbrB family looped-hinge helix DNA binding protein